MSGNVAPITSNEEVRDMTIARGPYDSIHTPAVASTTGTDDQA
jgi:hypothetical protein